MIIVQGTSRLIGNISAGQTVSVQGTNAGGQLSVLGGASNAGTIQVSTSGNVAPVSLAVTGSGAFTNTATGVISAVNLGGDFPHFAITGNLTNDGMVLDNNVTLPFQSCSFLNDATGVISGAGTISFPGTSSLLNDGIVTVADGQTLAITGTLRNFQNQTLLDGTYQVAGTLRFDSANIVTLAAAVDLNGAGAAIQTTASSHANALVNILATITPGGSLAVDNSNAFSTGNLTNNGSVKVGRTGTFTITTNHNYTQGPGALLTVDRGEFLVLGMFTNFDPGQLTLTGGTYHLISDTVNAGIFQFPGADIRTNAATIILDGPTPPTMPFSIVNPSGADALAQLGSNPGSLTVTNGRNLTLASLDNPGSLTVGAGSTFTVSTEFNDEGTAAIQAGGRLLITGTFDNFDGSNLNYGTFVVAGSLQFPGANIQTNAAKLILQPGWQVLDLAGNPGLNDLATNAPAGVLQLGIGAAFDVTAGFTNAGQVVIDGSKFGTIGDLMNGGSITLLDGGLVDTNSFTFYNDAGGVLAGSGGGRTAVYIYGNVVNAGMLLVGGATATGILDIMKASDSSGGSFTQTATGTLVVKLGGLTPGDGYDQLNIAGSATLDGTLLVQLQGSYAPSYGDTFQVLCAEPGGLMGRFANYSWPDIGELMLLPQYDDTCLTLVTTTSGGSPGQDPPSGPHVRTGPVAAAVAVQAPELSPRDWFFIGEGDLYHQKKEAVQG